jgi:uncharacterized membrane protein
MPSTYKRSFIKGIIWEGGTFILTSAVIYLFFGNITQSLTIGFLLTLIKMPLYFIYERIWKMIRWGKINHPPKKNIFSWLPFHSHSGEY